MKTNAFLVSLLILTSLVNTHLYGGNQSKEVDVATNTLDSIQYKIEYSTSKSFREGNTLSLDKIYNQLQEIKPKNNVINYWMAYINYYQSVFYLKTKDKDKSQLKLNRGIDLLEKQSEKNSEDYALLALLQNLSIQFKSGMSAGVTSTKAAKNAKKAADLDSLNLRAWYVLASNDFYTPESFGGGRKVESYLRKAISVPEQSKRNAYLPSWGTSNSILY